MPPESGATQMPLWNIENALPKENSILVIKTIGRLGPGAGTPEKFFGFAIIFFRTRYNH